MRVLFIVPDFYPNSTGFANASGALLDSIKTFGCEKYEIFVFTQINLPAGVKEYDGAKIFRYKPDKFDNRLTHSFLEAKKFRYIDRIIIDNKIDYIFFETNTFPWMENQIVKKYKDKVLVRIHSTADTEVIVFGKNRSIFMKKANSKVFEFMETVPNIVSTSSYYLNFVKRYYLKDNIYKIWDGKKYNVIYNSTVDCFSEFSHTLSNHFMTMGKLSENGLVQKGFVDLLDAVGLLLKEKKLPLDFNLKMIGDGVMYDFIEKYITKLGLKEYVSVIKKASHDEVFKMMSESKAIVLLSRYEGQSMFITEALSMGKPIIITKDNGMQNMIVDGENGYLVETGNVVDAASKLNKMMQQDFLQIQEMGVKSRQMFEEYFSLKAVYHQFDDVISKLN